MTDIAPLSGVGSPGYSPPPIDRSRVASPAPAQRPSDRVELSDRALLLSKLASLPDVRQDVVERARQAIAAGAYDTPDKLNEALDAMLDDLDVNA